MSLITHGIVDPYLEALALRVAARRKRSALAAAPDYGSYKATCRPPSTLIVSPVT